MLRDIIVRFIYEEDAQDLIEYALLTGFVGLVVLMAVQGIGTSLNASFDDINACLEKAKPGRGNAYGWGQGRGNLRCR